MDELDAVRDALGLDRVHLFGSSWGGMLAMQYILDNAGRPVSLVTAGSPASSPALERDLPGTARRDAGRRARADRAARGRGQDALRPEYEEAMSRFTAATCAGSTRGPTTSMRIVRPHGTTIYHYMAGPSEFRIIGTLGLGHHGPAGRDPGAGADDLRRVTTMPPSTARGGRPHPGQPARDRPRRVAPVLRGAARHVMPIANEFMARRVGLSPSLARAQRREEDHLADRAHAGQHHRQPVDADADARRSAACRTRARAGSPRPSGGPPRRPPPPPRAPPRSGPAARPDRSAPSSRCAISMPPAERLEPLDHARVVAARASRTATARPGSRPGTSAAQVRLDEVREQVVDRLRPGRVARGVDLALAHERHQPVAVAVGHRVDAGRARAIASRSGIRGHGGVRSIVGPGGRRRRGARPRSVRSIPPS